MRHATAASRGIRWGATPPEGGGKGTAGLADRRAARVVSSAAPSHFPASRDAETRDRPVCGLEHGLARAVFREPTTIPCQPPVHVHVCLCGTEGCSRHGERPRLSKHRVLAPWRAPAAF